MDRGQHHLWRPCGYLVDVMSGGGYTIEPDKVAVTLKPVEGGGRSPGPSLSSIMQSPPIP